MLEMNKVYCMDALEFLKQMPDNSVDAIITDPPYGLEFMGKEWDKFKETGKSNLMHGTEEEGVQGIYGREKNFKVLPRFPKEINKGLQEFTTNWAKECLRVLKPGGYLLSFGGTRTYHRMACGIENAGFEIRDCIMWIYGSGFPKSLNVGKKIDEMQGNEREFIGKGISGSKETHKTYNMAFEEGKTTSLMGGEFEITKGSSEWEGWGTALKPAVEPIVVARKPLSEKNVALNVLKWGTGGINIDEGRVRFQGKEDYEETTQKNRHADFNSNDGIRVPTKGIYHGDNRPPENYNPDIEKGRFPANIIFECICDELLEGKARGSQGHWSKTKTTGFGEFGNGKSEYFGVGPKDDMKCKIHTNPNCPCYMLDEQSGESKSSDTKRYRNTLGSFGMPNDSTPEYSDKGGASRFFYCAKASKSERNFGLDELESKEVFRAGHGNSEEDEVTKRFRTQMKNNHPTVKPVALIEYLIKLVTRENSIVLDPFIGSGTTAIACLKLNRQFIGIEKEPEYVKIANARIKPFLEQRKLIC
jgi:site-specific DNA-methyltransferase (adenine-specific)